MAYTTLPLDISKDRESLAALWAESFQDPRENPFTESGFRWLYEESPHEATRSWVVTDDHHAVVGCGSLFRADKRVAGVPIAAAMATMMAVTRKHRTLAASIAVQKAVLAGGAEMGIALLFGTPNRSAAAVCSRAGYSALGPSSDWVKWLPSTSESETPTDLLDVPNAWVSDADERFDALWHRASAHYDILGNKSASYLQWRYATFAAQLAHRYFCLFADSGDLLGYVSCYPSEDGLLITDLFAERPDDSPVIDTLLWRFIERAREENRSWIGLTFFGPSHFEDRLRRLGFTARPNDDVVVIHAGSGLPAAIAGMLHRRENWFAFGGELHF